MTPNMGMGRPSGLDRPQAPPPGMTPPGGPPAGGPPNQPQGDPGYLTPDHRCYQCEHFKEPGSCDLGVNGGTVDPEAGCKWFQMSDDDGDEGTGTEGAATTAQGGGQF